MLLRKRCLKPNPSCLAHGRTNSARGGDIDILLLTDQKLPLGKLLRIRRIILQKIGDQKLDLVNFSRDSDSPFKKLILETAVRL